MTLHFPKSSPSQGPKHYLLIVVIDYFLITIKGMFKIVLKCLAKIVQKLVLAASISAIYVIHQQYHAMLIVISII